MGVSADVWEALVTVLVAPIAMAEGLLGLSSWSSGLSMSRLLICAVGWEVAFRSFRHLTQWLIVGTSIARVLLGSGELPGENVEGLRQELRELNLPKLKSRALKSGVPQLAINHASDIHSGRLVRLHPHLVQTVLAKERQYAELRALEVLAELGPSYFVSVLHATIVGVRGVFHATSIVGAPSNVKLVMAAAHNTQWAATLSDIEQTNHLFLSYLLVDLAHMLASFPRLGGFDMIAHHTVFITCSVVCGSLRVLPFPFSWLILGELSTIWYATTQCAAISSAPSSVDTRAGGHRHRLGVRWFLIKTGRGADRAMDITNMLFAVTFVATRIVVYATGLTQLLWDLVSIWATTDEEGEQWLVELPQCKTRLTEEDEHEPEQFQTEAARDADASWIDCGRAQQSICGVVVLLVAGQVLNLIWARQIVRMARKSQRDAPEAKDRAREDTDVAPTESSNATGPKEKSA